MTRRERIENMAAAGLVAIVYFAILWGFLRLFGARVPVTDRIDGIGDLPFPVSRSWDVLAAPLLAGLVVFSLSFKNTNRDLHEEIELSLSWGTIITLILCFLLGVVPAFVITAVGSAIVAIIVFERGVKLRSGGKGVLLGFSLAFACSSGLIYGFLPGLIMGKAVLLASVVAVLAIAIIFAMKAGIQAAFLEGRESSRKRP